jgi:glycosyltransferase involved in cell wall biosynthesis
MSGRPAPRIRICRVIARMNIGGPAVHITQLTAGLDPERFEQRVVTGVEAPHEASMLGLARARGVEPVVIPSLGRELSARDDLVTLHALYRQFRTWKPHIVETHTAKAGTLGRVAALLARVPVRIHVFHGHVFHGYFSPRKTRVFLAIERALARISTRIITLNETQRCEILGFGIGTPEKVVAIPLGLELAPLLAGGTPGALRAELGLPPDSQNAPLVGIIGRLAPIKRHDVFLRAARSVMERVPDSHFVVIGDGETRSQVEALIHQLGLQEHVHLLGWRDHAATLAAFADLDVVALTSDNEGLPTALIEAMAAAKPVVATNVGGVSGLVQDGVTGLLAPPGDDRKVAEHLVHLLRDPAARQRMGAAGRTAAYPRYDVSTLLKTMSGFYTSLTSGQP